MGPIRSGWILYLAVPCALLAILALLAYLLRRSLRLQSRLQKEFVLLQQEKRIVFDFLHDLGEAFTGEIDRERLIQIIVACARKITGAKGSALYLWDEAREKLRAARVSGTFPPPLKIEGVIADQLAENPHDLETFLQLEPIPRDSTVVLAEVARTGLPAQVDRADLDARFPWFRQRLLQTDTYLAVPLDYRGQQLGVLALANNESGLPFGQADLEVLKSVAHQAAYSLAQTQVYHELAEKRKLDHEIEVAREIQRVLLPNRAPHVPGFDWAALNLPAQQVSGDYYDFIPIDSRHWGLAVADVSGKGVPAALIMAMCRSVLRSKAVNCLSPAQVLRAVNALLFPDMREDMFITMIYFILGPEGLVRFARAGHEPPLLCRGAIASIQPMVAPGMGLGIDPGGLFDTAIADVELHLAPRDTLVIYTDGVTEARDLQGEEFGLDRCKASLAAHDELSVEALIGALAEEVRLFSAGRAPHDDMTLAAIRRSDAAPGALLF